MKKTRQTRKRTYRRRHGHKERVAVLPELNVTPGDLFFGLTNAQKMMVQPAGHNGGRAPHGSCNGNQPKIPERIC